MRLIILSAGQGYKIGNFNKLLLVDPITGLTILDTYIELFSDENITIVVGYKAINIMNKYPNLNYVYNQDWHITKDSYSLGLALNEEPCYILHSDLIISKDLKTKLDSFQLDCAATLNNESRLSSSLNCSIKDDNISNIYQGELLNHNDPELIGIYKFVNLKTLKYLKINCLKHKNLFIGQNIKINNDIPLKQVRLKKTELAIIKTPLDYINFIKNRNSING